MKIKFIALLVFLIASRIFGQSWSHNPPHYHHTIAIVDLPPENGDFRFLVKASTEAQELNHYGVMDITTQEMYNSYHVFSGDGESGEESRLCFPPGWIESADLAGRPYKYGHISSYAPGCSEMPAPVITGYPDSIIFSAGFGHLEPIGTYITPIMAGYIEADIVIHHLYRIACVDLGSGPPVKSYAYFADSTYSKLPDSVLISGNSPLYFKAKLLHQADSVWSFLWLSHTPDSIIRVSMTNIESTYHWIGHIDNSRLLGLKSYAKAVLKVNCAGFDATDIDSCRDTVVVCLPKADVKGRRGLPPDTLYRDTVYISHDSMKIAQDVPVFLVCKDDATGKEMNLKDDIDSVAYRYRSFWISNTSQAETTLYIRYPRIYRRDSTYVRWTNAFPRDSKTCLVKLNKDSLYVIGGKLTIEARGALKHVNNINNTFMVNSDSITTAGDTIRHLILIDDDPSNTEFSSQLGSDRMRAIAWQEYCGLGQYRCHGHTRPQWNHYWDDFVIPNDTTCLGTHLPCESNADSNTATGVMQILRTVWERQFNGAIEDGPEDSLNGSPFYCKWDSVAWNWKVFVHKGNYIYNKYLPTKYTAAQELFSDTCLCDTFPSSKNKADLRVYGYTRGFPEMRAINDDKAWKTNIAKKPGETGYTWYHEYVQNVRKYYFRRPWQ